MKKVNALRDDSGHWYLIPNELVEDFDNDLEDYKFCESGNFDNKYREYRTGGDLNLVQLYIDKD